MRSINIDSITTLQTIAGGAIVKQGTTIFDADSIAINQQRTAKPLAMFI